MLDYVCVTLYHVTCSVLFIYIMFHLPLLHRMGSDWNQVMSQYGSFLSQIDELPMGTQHSEFPVDGQPEGSRTPAVTKKPTQRTKLANFTAEEDTRVCHAWLAVSCDPIINTGQKRQGFWSRITEAYNSRRGTLPERSTKSLMSRWDTIKTQCSTFAGYMMAVLRQNPSGLSDADKVNLSCNIFTSLCSGLFVGSCCNHLLYVADITGSF